MGLFSRVTQGVESIPQPHALHAQIMLLLDGAIFVKHYGDINVDRPRATVTLAVD